MPVAETSDFIAKGMILFELQVKSQIDERESSGKNGWVFC